MDKLNLLLDRGYIVELQKGFKGEIFLTLNSTIEESKKEDTHMKNQRLIDVMKNRGITQLELARLTRMSPSDLCFALNGKRPWFPSWRKRISEALNMSEAELFPEFVQRKEG